MHAYSAAHLSDSQVRQELIAKVSKRRIDEAELLVLIAEADFRKLYVPEGYPSMHAYCIEFFHFSKDAAFKRIHAARAARAYPVLFEAVADGRLHLSAVRLLASHLTPDNVDDLVARATHKNCEEIEVMLARRVVRLETLVEPGAGSATPALMIPQQAARPVGAEPVSLGQLAPSPAVEVGPAPEPAAQPEPAVWVALSKRAHEKLQYAQALLGRDASLVMERALDALIAKAEKQKFAATTKPRAPRESTSPRCIPAHNQLEAERAFGPEFKQRKCDEARVADAPPTHHPFRDDVIAGLCGLGVGATEARLVVERSGALRQATLEESMRTALQCLGPRRRPPS